MKKSSKTIQHSSSLITLDLGNSSTTAGLLKRGRLVSSKRFTYDTFPNNVQHWIKSGCLYSENVIFCSVNPKYTKLLNSVLKRFTKKGLVIEVKNTLVPLRNKYKNPLQAGVDRLVNVHGAAVFYGSPCLVVDIGTAITFDLGGTDSSFEGGLIFPGPHISFESLQAKTANIGQFPLDFPQTRHLVARSTRECLIEGTAYGYGHAIRGIIEEFRAYARKRWKKNLKVILTGGDLQVVEPFLSKQDHMDPHLTLKALAHLYDQFSLPFLGRTQL